MFDETVYVAKHRVHFDSDAKNPNRASLGWLTLP